MNWDRYEVYLYQLVVGFVNSIGAFRECDTNTGCVANARLWGVLCCEIVKNGGIYTY